MKKLADRAQKAAIEAQERRMAAKPTITKLEAWLENAKNYQMVNIYDETILDEAIAIIEKWKEALEMFKVLKGPEWTLEQERLGNCAVASRALAIDPERL